jgi:arylsulfatase A-like enzyme
VTDARLGIAASLSLGAGMGFYDLGLSVVRSAPEAYGRFPAILPPLGATTAAVSLVAALFLIPATLLPMGARRHHGGPLALALGTLLGSSFVLGEFYGVLRLEQTAGTVRTGFLVLCLSMAVAAWEYEVMKRAWATTRAPRNAAVVLLAMPLVMGAASLFAWVWVYRPPDFAGGPLLGCLGGFLISAAILVALSRRLASRVSVEKWLGGLAMVLLAPLLTLFAASTDGRPAGRPTGAGGRIAHVILLSIDTLRADAVSFLSPGAGPTPHLDALASDSVVYTRAYSPAPWTLPAFASIMTGTAPPVHGVRRPTQRIPSRLPTLAERMRAAGYRTAAIGQNPWLRPPQGMSRGFDQYDIGPRNERGGSIGARLLARLDPERYKPSLSTTEIADDAVRWLRRNAGRDFFLWIHFFKPHGPYAPPPQYRPPGPPPPGVGYTVGGAEAVRAGELVPTRDQREWIRKLYDAEVRYVDDNVGRLLAEIRRLEIYDGSLIVLVSDHGEEFWDHGGFEHGHTLYDELLRVPLFVKLPGEEGRLRRDEIVPTGSIAAMILDLCGLGTEPGSLSYPSLFPWSLATRPGPELSVLSAAPLYFEDREAATFGTTAYIRHRTSGREEVYDLGRDPSEQHDLAAADPGRLRAGRAVLSTLESSAEALRRHYGLEDETPVTIDPETLEDLRSLGYGP